ncbi:hypothetical protein HY493_02820 [Candidatus Woesearchaeota archaeon]|nr:hypothetical protein [Candidatus Woesearchaeota archaeon]
MLGVYDYVYGSAQLGAAFLAVIAGLIALSLFRHAKSELRAWKYLLVALVLFAVVEIIGALAAFGVGVAPYWTHILTSIILFFVITALTVQIHINRGWKE